MLTPRLLLWIATAAAVAGPAAAQMPTMMGVPQTYRLEPNSFVDQPLDPADHACVDRKPRPGPAPRVIRTMPAPGSVVRPGQLVLRITFDQPMACKAIRTASPFPVPCPAGGGAVLISPDRRTLTTVCVVEAGSVYSMPLVDFVGDGGVTSERYDLAFTTSTAAPMKDARQAMSLERAGPVEH